MNVLKHMEATFLFALGVAAFATVAVETSTPAQASVVPAAAVESSVATGTTMAVVKVTAKRMSAAEKAQALAHERSGARA